MNLPNIHTTLLHEHADEIISSLGGLDTIIKLCATHPNIKDHVDLEKFSDVLDGIATSHNAHSNGDSSSPNSNQQSPNDSTIVNPKSSETKNIQRHLMVSNLLEYYLSSIVINIKANNNLYFILFPQHIANFMFYNVLSSNWYLPIASGLVILFGAIGMFSWYIFNSRDVYYVLISIAYSIFMIVALSYLMSVNIRVCGLLLQSFDFWFKIYNILIIFATRAVLNANADELGDTIENIPLWYAIITFLAVLFICSFCFLIDACYVSLTIKRAVVVCVSCFVFFLSTETYFYIKDYTWNPFKNFPYSQISFKSLYVSSLVNLGIFLLKPVFSDVMRYYRRKYCGSRYRNKKREVRVQQEQLQQSPDHNHDSDSYERCGSIYKRPRIKWNHEADAIKVQMTTNMSVTRSFSS